MVLLTDQGRNVDGRVIQELCSDYGITKKVSSPYHPQGGDEAERSIHSIKQALRCLLAEQERDKAEWPTILQQAAFVHNSLQNSNTKFSPQELMYGTTLRSSIGTVGGTKPDVTADIVQTTNDMDMDSEPSPHCPVEEWQQAEDNSSRAKEPYKKVHVRGTASTHATVGGGRKCS